MDQTILNGKLIARSVVTWVRDHERCSGILLLSMLMLGAAIYRWLEFGSNAAPPGSDGGQWIAFAHQMFGGEEVRAGFETYPPLFPFLVKISPIDDEFLSLKLLGIAISVLICVPMYFILRSALSHLYSAMVAALMLLNPYSYEILCFGGYPQLLGTFFMILAIYLLMKGMDTGHKKWFLLSAIAAAATAGSNALPTIMLVATSAVVIASFSHKLWRENRSLLYDRVRLMVIWGIMPAAFLCLALFTIYYDYLDSAGTAKNSSISLIAILEWLGYAWKWEFIFWIVTINVAIVTCIANPGLYKDRYFLLSTGAAAFLIAGLGGTLFFRELRSIIFLEIGIVFLLGLILPPFVSSLQRRSAPQVSLVLSLVVILVLVSCIGEIGMRRFRIAYNWYEVVDASVLPAVEWLEDNRIQGAKVAATEAEGGHNYGWWIEGCTRMQTYAAANPAFFIDEKEHAQIDLANYLLMEDISPAKISDLADKEDIHFLFLDKRVFQSPLDNFIEAGFSQGFENDTIAVMEKDARPLLSQCNR